MNQKKINKICLVFLLFVGFVYSLYSQKTKSDIVYFKDESFKLGTILIESVDGKNIYFFTENDSNERQKLSPYQVKEFAILKNRKKNKGIWKFKSIELSDDLNLFLGQVHNRYEYFLLQDLDTETNFILIENSQLLSIPDEKNDRVALLEDLLPLQPRILNRRNLGRNKKSLKRYINFLGTPSYRYSDSYFGIKCTYGISTTKTLDNINGGFNFESNEPLFIYNRGFSLYFNDIIGKNGKLGYSISLGAESIVSKDYFKNTEPSIAYSFNSYLINSTLKMRYLLVDRKNFPYFSFGGRISNLLSEKFEFVEIFKLTESETLVEVNSLKHFERISFSPEFSIGIELPYKGSLYFSPEYSTNFLLGPRGSLNLVHQISLGINLF